MRNMNLMLTKTPPEDIKQHILPVVYNALDAESSQVQVRIKKREVDGIMKMRRIDFSFHVVGLQNN